MDVKAMQGLMKRSQMYAFQQIQTTYFYLSCLDLLFIKRVTRVVIRWPISNGTILYWI